MESAAVPRPLVKRHHGLVRVAHWLNAIVLLGMIASGLQIYAAFRIHSTVPAFQSGEGSAAGSRAGSTGISRSLGPSSSPASSISPFWH